MARRVRRGPAVSLFAFQDIITSVSGIVIVMVLLLSLELVDRPGAAAQAELQEVQKQVKSLQAALAQLAADSTDVEDLIDDLVATSPVDLAQEIAAFETETQALQAAVQQLQVRNTKLIAASRQAEAARFDQRESRELLDQVRTAVRELDRTIAEERGVNRPLYAMARGTGESGWLVVLEGKQITTASLGRASVPRVFNDRPRNLLLTDRAVDQCLDWMRTPACRSDYFLLLVRPEGISQFDQVESFLTKQRMKFGFDLIGQEQVVLHPERGAAP